MKILLLGKNGQVGWELQRSLAPLGEVQALDRHSTHYCGDLSKPEELVQTVLAYKPDFIVNAAAHTAVDKAESEPELAKVLNTDAPAALAKASAQVGGWLVHYSTDYVFADTKQIAYLETDIAGPVEQLSVYGQSKLAGEKAIEEAFNLAHDSGHTQYADKFSRYFILRTSWVYGDGGNFIRTMLRLAGERDQLKVVADQIGVPSSAQWLAEVGLQMAGSRVESGIYHAVPDGETSWHGLADFEIKAAATEGEGIDRKSENILPIPAIDYPLPAKRPYNSRLNNTKLKQALSEMAFTGQYPHWQEQVEAYVKDYVTSSLKS